MPALVHSAQSISIKRLDNSFQFDSQVAAQRRSGECLICRRERERERDNCLFISIDGEHKQATVEVLPAR
jgi:hypothetical protein